MMQTPSHETIHVDGLQQHARISVDRWGVSHLEAQTKQDLFFVQGFNAARDRLWQIDLWRKRGLGLLATDFGPGYLAQDHASRHFLYRGDMHAEWKSYGPDTEEICTAFVSGINAFIALVESGRFPSPPEFELFKSRPSRWNAEDVVRIRSHALTRNALSEVLRANVLARADARTDLLRRSLDPAIEPQFDPCIDPATIPVEALDLFKLATATVTFENERLHARLDQAHLWRNVTDLGEVVRAAQEEGSNNWVVAGMRTQTGRPILASDPHRSHAVPSLRYLVHLTMPGFNAIGAGEPIAPGISLGHNGKVAFGLTIHGADQEDVYVFQTSPENPAFYRYGDGWRAFDQTNDIFKVKGYPDQTLRLTHSHNGPVLWTDETLNIAIGMRSVWFEPGTSAYLGSLRSMRAQNVSEFGASLSSWGAPSVNHVCADIEGATGWFTAGLTPMRHNYTGLLPVPGNGLYEWKGFIPSGNLAHELNPRRGFVATANEMNLPADWPHDSMRIGHEWADDSRASRIAEVLNASTNHSVEESCQLQCDVRSVPAERICALLKHCVVADTDAAVGRDLLQGWSYDLAPQSAAAALFEVWWMLHLKPALLLKLSGDPSLRPLLIPGDVTQLLNYLENPDEHFGADPYDARNAMLLSTLSAAIRDCSKRLGANPDGWQWGQLHHAYFQHAATPVRQSSGKTDWDVGPFPLGGSASTVMNTGYRISDFRCITGASVRLVIDVGDWDKSVFVNAPGQSGDPATPHYSDLMPLWARSFYAPLLYTRAAIDEHINQRIDLMPG